MAKNPKKESDTKTERQRIYIDFTPEAVRRLEDIKKMAEARSNAELVRNSLRLYEWFLARKKEGNRVCIIKGDSVKEVEFLF